MAERTVRITKTANKTIRVQIPEPGCQCTPEDGNNWGCWTSLYGQWTGEPDRRPQQKEDQVLEVTRYPAGYTACRDHTVLLTYGRIKTVGIEKAVEFVGNNENLRDTTFGVYIKQIIEWFVEVVDRTQVSKEKPLAQHLAEIVDAEVERDRNLSTRQWAMIIQLGIQEHERYVANYRKGITNEDKKEKTED